MADEDATQDNDPVKPQPFAADIISLDDLDKILAEDDPDFAKDMSGISGDEDLKKAEVDSLSLDDSHFLDSVDDGELQPTFMEQKLPRLQKWVNRLRQAPHRILLSRHGLKASAKSLLIFLKTGLPERIKFYRRIVGQALSHTKARAFAFKTWPLQKKLALALFVLMIAGIAALVHFNLSGVWLPTVNSDFVADLGAHAQHEYHFQNKDLIPFYQAFPQPEFPVLMDKTVVNLKRSMAGENPMIAFQAYVNADSRDTAVEIKARGTELLDLISRAVEGLTYDQAYGSAGKERLKKTIRAALNGALNEGHVDQVYFKIIILKP